MKKKRKEICLQSKLDTLLKEIHQGLFNAKVGIKPLAQKICNQQFASNWKGLVEGNKTSDLLHPQILSDINCLG